MKEHANTIIDLRPILVELIGYGMRQAEIARHLGVTRATVNGALHDDSQPWVPRYDTGKRLVDLHTKIRRSQLRHPEPAEVA